MKTDHLYSDVDLRFIPHPLTGDVPVVVNVEAIRRSLRHIVMLEMFDIPFQPTYEAGLKGHLFDSPSHLTVAALRSQIEFIIKKLERRVRLRKVDVEIARDGQSYNITISYTVISLDTDDTVQLAIQRIR